MCCWQLIVFIISNFFTKQAVPRCNSNLQYIIFMSIFNELIAQHAMENLNHTSYHFSDLIIQKRLSFQIKPNKFNPIYVIRISNFHSFLVHIPELTCFHFDHITLGCHLMCFNIFRIVMVFFSANETFPMTL